MTLEEMLSRLGKREPTMRLALSLLADDAVIVECGCTRTPDNWEGDGMSTVVFTVWADTHNGWLDSVDISRANIETACRILGDSASTPFERRIMFHEWDSLEYLSQRDRPIDLLYLDSFDFPYGALLDIYGGREDLEAARGKLMAMLEDEIVADHYALVLPCQRHCRDELATAHRLLRPGSLVLIDDAGLPGGGKARLAKKLLASEGWECLADEYQTLWRWPKEAAA